MEKKLHDETQLKITKIKQTEGLKRRAVTASLYFCASSHSNVQGADYRTITTTTTKLTNGTILRVTDVS